MLALLSQPGPGSSPHQGMGTRQLLALPKGDTKQGGTGGTGRCLHDLGTGMGLVWEHNCFLLLLPILGRT